MIVFVGALKSNTIIKQKERLLNGKWYDDDDWEYYGNDCGDASTFSLLSIDAVQCASLIWEDVKDINDCDDRGSDDASKIFS